MNDSMQYFIDLFEETLGESVAEHMAMNYIHPDDDAYDSAYEKEIEGRRHYFNRNITSLYEEWRDRNRAYR